METIKKHVRQIDTKKEVSKFKHKTSDYKKAPIKSDCRMHQAN